MTLKFCDKIKDLKFLSLNKAERVSFRFRGLFLCFAQSSRFRKFDSRRRANFRWFFDLEKLFDNNFSKISLKIIYKIEFFWHFCWLFPITSCCLCNQLRFLRKYLLFNFKFCLISKYNDWNRDIEATIRVWMPWSAF